MLIVNVGFSLCENISLLDSILEGSKNIIGKVRGNRRLTVLRAGRRESRTFSPTRSQHSASRSFFHISSENGIDISGGRWSHVYEA